MKRPSKEQIKTWVKENGMKVAQSAFAAIGIGYTAYSVYNSIMFGSAPDVKCSVGANAEEDTVRFVWTKKDRWGHEHPYTKERIDWDEGSRTADGIADLFTQAGKICRKEQESFE